MAPQIQLQQQLLFLESIGASAESKSVGIGTGVQGNGMGKRYLCRRKNITQWEGYIRDYQANPSNYPNGYIFDDQGNLFLMRENDMFADMMDNFDSCRTTASPYREAASVPATD